jgi:perosamine synthetase
MIYCGEPQVGQLEREYVMRVLDSGRLTEGEWVKRFARALSQVVILPCHPVASGTAALHLALLGCGVSRGDEVIVPALSYIATANAVLMCGAKPVFVDVDPLTWTIRPEAAEAKLSKKTAAIMPVHLYGVPAASMRGLVADHYQRTGRRIRVVEDCAEAFVAKAGPLHVGRDGDAAAFSFYGSKTITTGGEGGAVVYSDGLIGDRVWHLAHQGQTKHRYVHDCLAWNYRMTEMQAAFGVAQLVRLWEFHAKRRNVFGWYDQRLAGRFKRQGIAAGCRHGYWAYAVLTPRRFSSQEVAQAMLEAGVETRPVFPALYRQRHLATGDVHAPVASDVAYRGLVLPTHAGLTEEDVDTVCKELIRATEAA